MSMDFTLELLIRAFFGRGDWEVCHSELCLLVVGSYSKPKFHRRLSLAAESWAHFSHDPKVPEKPTHNCPFVHRTNSSGPVSHKFFSCRSSVMIRWTSVFGSPTSSAINLTLKRRSLSRTAFTRATLFSHLEVEARPACCSSSPPSLPSLNALYHLRTWDEDKTASP